MNARIFSLVLALTLMASVASAQTRKIGHRSHSGSPATFALMMEDDHLGDPPETRFMPLKFPTYNVDPFIAKVRRYYEGIAKQTQPNSSPAVETPKGSSPEITPSKPDTVKPVPSPSSKTPKAASPKRKAAQGASAPVPAPDFLVQSRPKSTNSVSNIASEPASSVWILILVLGGLVAPVVFVASTRLGRQASPA